MNHIHEPRRVCLPCGLQVITVERPYGKTFGASLTYGAGSSSDPVGLPGLAHFCEHLAFRGPNQQVSEELSGLGAYVNAHTTSENTSFDVSGHVDQLGLALELFANVVRSPELTEDDLAAERDVFRHEISESDPLPPRDEKLDRFWGTITGDPNWRTSWRKQLKAIKRFEFKTVVAFRQAHMIPSNACLAVVGPIKHDQLLQVVEQRISEAKVQQAAKYQTRPKDSVSGKRTMVFVDSNPYVWIFLVHLVERTDPVMRLTCSILAHQLGGGPQSELFRRLRVERALAYHVEMADRSSLRYTAAYFYCCVHRRAVREAIATVLEHHDRIAGNGIDESLLESAKQRERRRLETVIDYPAQFAAYLACEALRPYTAEQMLGSSGLQRVAALTTCEVNQAAAMLLSPQHRYAFVGGNLGLLSRFRVRRTLNANLHPR